MVQIWNSHYGCCRNAQNISVSKLCHLVCRCNSKGDSWSCPACTLETVSRAVPDIGTVQKKLKISFSKIYAEWEINVEHFSQSALSAKFYRLNYTSSVLHTEWIEFIFTICNYWSILSRGTTSVYITCRTGINYFSQSAFDSDQNQLYIDGSAYSLVFTQYLFRFLPSLYISLRYH